MSRRRRYKTDHWGRALTVKMKDSWKTKLKDGDWVWVIVAERIGYGYGIGVNHRTLGRFVNQAVEVKVLAKPPEPCQTCAHLIDAEKVVWDLSEPGHCRVTVEFPNGLEMDVSDIDVYPTRSAASKALINHLESRIKSHEAHQEKRRQELERGAENLKEYEGYLERVKAKLKPARKKKRKVQLKGKVDERGHAESEVEG